jgi:hypothetical protein
MAAVEGETPYNLRLRVGRGTSQGIFLSTPIFKNRPIKAADAAGRTCGDGRVEGPRAMDVRLLAGSSSQPE